MSQVSKEVAIKNEAKEGEIVPTVEQFATREAKLTLQKHTELMEGRLPIWAEVARAYPVLVSADVSEEEAIKNQAALNTYTNDYKRQLYLAFGLGEPKMSDNAQVMRKGLAENRSISEASAKVYVSETKRVMSALCNPETYEKTRAAIEHCIERKLGKTALFKAIPTLTDGGQGRKKVAKGAALPNPAEGKKEDKAKAEQKPESKVEATTAKFAEAAFRAKVADTKASPTEAVLAYVTAEGKSEVSDLDVVMRQYRSLSTIIQSSAANLAAVMRKMHVTGTEDAIQKAEQQIYAALSAFDGIASTAQQRQSGNVIQQQDDVEEQEAETEEEALEKLGLTGTDGE